MPVIFLGHGSPMNTLDGTDPAKIWKQLGEQLPLPKAILGISAHWFTSENLVNSSNNPKQLYDFFGFPRELYEIKYQPKGSLGLANQVVKVMDNCKQTLDHGIDHGIWAPLRHIFPNADIPVAQLSVNGRVTFREAIQLGESLRPLRDEGILIFASGNIVHNLSMADYKYSVGFPWAYEFDEYITDAVKERDFEKIIYYHRAGESSRNAFPTTEHYLPLLYALGASNGKDNLEVFSNLYNYGSISLTSYMWK